MLSNLPTFFSGRDYFNCILAFMSVFVCLCSKASLYGDIGWSILCSFGITWSYTFVLQFCDVIVCALSSLTITEVWSQGNRTYKFSNVIVCALSSLAIIGIWPQGHKTYIHLFYSFVM